MNRLLLVLSILLLQAPAAPPSQTAQASTASIRGTVLGTGNQPVSGADVTVFWSQPAAFSQPNQAPRAVADNNGRFVVNDLSPGGYRIRVRAAGYVSQEYRPDTGNVIELIAGQSLEGITIRLVADAVISGRITSTNGSPLLKMEVLAVRKVYDANGWPTFTQAGALGETNDRGEYRISGLAAGSYYVLASSPLVDQSSIARSEITQRPGGPSPGVYASVFYPGFTESSKAGMVQVQPGQESRNIDIALPRLPLYRIRGKVTDRDGLPIRRVMLVPLPANPDSFVRGIGGTIPGPAYDPAGRLVSPYRPDGTFELTGVAPGTYWLNAQLEAEPLTPEQRRLLSTPGVDPLLVPIPTLGTAKVTVIDADVENVEITIVHSLAVNGAISVEGGLPAPLSSLKPELRVVMIGQITPVVGRVTMTADGKFTYTNIPAGEFRMTLSGMPSDLYIKEGRLGNIDVLGQLLDLTRQPTAMLRLILARGAEIRGTVTDSASNAVASQQVVLIPDQMPNRPDLYKTTVTDANGRFTLQGVAPGAYKAFAWKSLEPFRYFDPEFVREFEDRGSVVRVGDTPGAIVEVKLIP